MNQNAIPAPCGKFLTESGKAEQAKAEKRIENKEQRTKQAQRREKILTKAGLLLGDGLLVYMVLNGLIDQFYGVLFVAGLSMLFGHNVK